jgi:protein-disulfide isomerase
MLKRFLTGAVLTVALLAQTPAQAPPKPASPLNTVVLEAYVRHLLVWPASVDVTIGEPTPAPVPGFYAVKIRGSLGGQSQEESFYVSADSQNIIRGEVFNVNASPFEGNLKVLKTDNQPFLGTPGAPVTVVEFADFQCPYCKQEAGVVRNQLMAAFPGQIQLIYMDYPLVPIHPFARGAAIMGRCIYTQNNDSFWAYHDWIFQQQSEITAENLRPMALEYAKSDKNLDITRLTACMTAPEPRAQVDRTMVIGDELKINATPTFFINGRRLVGTIALDNLKLVVEHEIAWAKTQATKSATSAPSATDCCSVQLSLPGAGKAAAK